MKITFDAPEGLAPGEVTVPSHGRQAVSFSYSPAEQISDTATIPVGVRLSGKELERKMEIKTILY